MLAPFQDYSCLITFCELAVGNLVSSYLTSALFLQAVGGAKVSIGRTDRTFELAFSLA
jgi:hypothetical protein